MDRAVEDKYAALAPETRRICLAVRERVFSVAPRDPRIGQITETIKWGEPAYLTQSLKVGTTLRIWQTKAEQKPAIFVNCQTILVPHIRDLYPQKFGYEGNRAIIVREQVTADIEVIDHVIQLILTYHLWK